VNGDDLAQAAVREELAGRQREASKQIGRWEIGHHARKPVGDASNPERLAWAVQGIAASTAF
jgi:hypothetical protein